MFSNELVALPLAEKDRRVYAMRCADQAKDKAYYDGLYGMLEDRDFLAAVWTYLATRDISGMPARAPLNELKQAMIEAGRTEDQQRAVDLAGMCPRDVIASSDLMRAAAPLDMRTIYVGEGQTDEVPAETASQRQKRSVPIGKALEAIGCQTSARKVWLGASERVWIVRNLNKWAIAPTDDLKREARLIREDFIACDYRAAALMERWNGSQPGAAR
jgi:hypothetical protein